MEVWQGFQIGDEVVISWTDAPEQIGKVVGFGRYCPSFDPIPDRIIVIETDDGIWTRRVESGGVRHHGPV